MTAQGVPAFEWSEDALRVRQFLYEHWCTYGRGANLRATHEATGLGRDEIVAAYKELAFGEIVFDLSTQNMYNLKCPPFAAFPTQVEVWKGDRFHAYAGCALESVALSRMPPFQDQELRLETYCACCLAPISLRVRDGQVLSCSVPSVRIHLSKVPDEWGIPDVLPMCDSMNYVIDPDHAERYERKLGRRGVLLDLEQARALVKGVADNRMWDYHWNPGPMRPGPILERIRGLGVDVTNWDPGAA
jgi:hypothetical protein